MITLDEAIEILSRPKTMKGTPQDILEAHDMAITALRQPEIIRCRECKEWEMYGNECQGWCGKLGLISYGDDYCGWAELREVTND